MFDTQRGLTDRQGAHTRCHCAHSKAIDRYHSRKAHKQYIWPRRMAINEHQLMDSSIGEGLCGDAHALFALHQARRCFSRAKRRRRSMPTDGIKPCSVSEVRSGIAHNVLQAFAAARRLHAANCADGVLLCEFKEQGSRERLTRSMSFRERKRASPRRGRFLLSVRQRPAAGWRAACSFAQNV